MPAAWETASRHNVLCAVLHVETTTVAWSLGLRNLQVPGPVLPLTGMPFDMARNQACQTALAGGFSHLFFLDSDVVAPPDAVLRLLGHNLPLVSGLYCRRSPPHGVPVMIKNGAWVTRFREGSLVEVDLVGAGCLLVRRDLLEQCPPQRPGHHWFDWKVNYQGLTDGAGKLLYPPEECLSEDFTFNVHVRKKLGVRTYVDTGVRCKHIGFAEATYNSFVPCNTHAA